MLERTILDSIRKELKKINKIKNLEEKISLFCSLKEKTQMEFNDYLDDLFSEVDLKPRKAELFKELED